MIVYLSRTVHDVYSCTRPSSLQLLSSTRASSIGAARISLGSSHELFEHGLMRLMYSFFDFPALSNLL